MDSKGVANHLADKLIAGQTASYWCRQKGEPGMVTKKKV